MLTILWALFPVFGIIALAFVAGRTRYLGADVYAGLNQFVAQVTLPVLTFHSIATLDAADLAMPTMVIVVVGASYIVWCIAFGFERWRGIDAGHATISGLAAAYGNSAFIGLPVCLAVLGPAGFGPSAVVIALNTLFVFGGAVFVCALTGRGPQLPGAVLRTVARQLGTNPLLIGGVLGVVVALLRLPLPVPVDVLMVTLGNATGPCALVAIGLFMAQSIGGGGSVDRSGASLFAALAGKLLLMPLITIGMLAVLPPLPPAWRMTAILMSAMPTASSAFVLATESGRRSMHVAAVAVILSTIAALATLPILLFALEYFGSLQ